MFRPPIHRAVIGDVVRYERRDPGGRVLGYLTYEVEKAFEFQGTNFGREFVLKLTLTDKRDKRTRRRRIRVTTRAGVWCGAGPGRDEPSSRAARPPAR